MNASDATSFIENRLLPDLDPALPAGTIESDLLPMAATCDTDGIEPDGDDWTPTYSVRGCYRAIAEGYTIKYGLAVGRFEFTTDGQTFRRQQTLDQLEHQRKMYARKVQDAPSTIGRDPVPTLPAL